MSNAGRFADTEANASPNWPVWIAMVVPLTLTHCKTMAPTAKYTLLPTAAADEEALLGSTSRDASDDEGEFDTEPLPAHRESFPPTIDPRFIQPKPATWKRAGLLLLIVFLFWLAYQLQVRGRPKAAQ
ncbi:hypothetical protein FB45DRAFT_1034815 [Roridomyces roridus]|uniref:Uncharacterized protein n=1 Tax=Roridomyces roridus TaxID=1738132 RepID=A0AAD7FEZ5_9AGAR|nr:hypothetical protein FB45DRAFT_1034815 [Roridomyces roridus]